DPGWGEWESTRGLRLSISEQFFPWLICASVAPRGFIFSFELGWPHGVEEESIWTRYKKVFDLYGQRERLAAVDGFGPFPGPGEVTDVGVQHRQKIYPILKRWNGVPVPAEEYHNPRPEEDLMCLTPGEAARRKPKTASEIALRMAEEHLSSARAKRNSLDAAQRITELRSTLRAKLGGQIEPSAQPEVHVLWTKADPRFTVEGIEAASERGFQIPFLLIRPKMANPSGKLPVVVGFSQQGKAAFLSERRAEIGLLLEKGAAICLVDVRGVGEMEKRAGHGSNSTSMAATSLMLGDTALAARLRDARTVLRYLSARADIDSKRIVLWGDSTANVNPRDLMLDQSVLQSPGPQTIYTSEPLGGVLVLVTALYEDDVRAIVASRGLISYVSVLKDRFAYVPQDVIVPGILESADIPDIVAALRPRGVRIESAVDGRNRALTRAEMEEELGAVHEAPSTVMTVEHPGGPDTAAWMAAQWSK
ncbi:MAG: alpha/beta hydrolase family protein, partial [Bryobacteraceae bacterium]